MSDANTPVAKTAAATDLEKIPLAQVLSKLGVAPDRGLTDAEAKQRLARYGPNALVEKEQSLAATRDRSRDARLAATDACTDAHSTSGPPSVWCFRVSGSHRPLHRGAPAR